MKAPVQDNFTNYNNKRMLALINNYRKPELRKSIWQLVNTVIPYMALWVVMIYVAQISWWLVVPISILASGFMIRAFIIFHDCGHGAFFKSDLANEIVGSLMGMLALTPYHHWHNAHRIHHGTSGNLDKRGVGDVWTMTTDEYMNATKWRRLYYRIYRNPVVMFLIGAPIVFLIVNRFTRKTFSKTEKYSVYITNVGIGAFAAGISAFAGIQTYLFIQILTMYFAAITGVYLFYVQHQFPDVEWYDDDNWDYVTVSIAGSSYFKLPRVLQWFSGNIGFHHIHHLSSGIPNYNLEKCYKDNPEFQTVQPVTLWKSFSTLRLKLWDENLQKLLTYAEARKLGKMKVANS